MSRNFIPVMYTKVLAAMLVVASVCNRSYSFSLRTSSISSRRILSLAAEGATLSDPAMRRAAKVRSKPVRSRSADPQPTCEDRDGQKTDAIGDLFRIEVAQRLKEIKLMTQKHSVSARAGGDLLAAFGNTSSQRGTSAPEDPSALEAQISTLSIRIHSIAQHLQESPKDAVSRKGLVVLVKQRRRLLESLRHRDHTRWLSITESLGLRQRPEPTVDHTPAARRARRRERGRRRRLAANRKEQEDER